MGIKSILTILAIIASLTSNAAITCKQDGRWYYPQDEKSVKIAKMLKVKTCNGKRFKEVVKKLGETSNVPESVKDLSTEEIAKLIK